MRNGNALFRWVTEFARAREASQRNLPALVERLAAELGVDGPTDLLPDRVVATERRSWAAAVEDLVRARPHHAAARRALAGGERTALIAVSTKRLPLDGDSPVREQLGQLLEALPGTRQPDVLARELDACPRLVLFDPRPVSPLRVIMHRLDQEGVAVVDDGVLLCEAFRRLPRAMASAFREGLRSAREPGGGRMALAAVLLDEGYRGMLEPVDRCRGLLLTSNAFATELLRFRLLREPRCESLVEVLHGVPTQEWTSYLAQILRSVPEPARHRFVPQIPGLALDEPFAEGPEGVPCFAVNVALNRYAANGRGTVEAVMDLHSRLFTPGAESFVVAWIGGTSHDPDYLASRSFAVERAMIQRVREMLIERGRRVAISYSPHPARPLDAFERHPFFAENDVLVTQDTVSSWLVADAAFALISSAAFEAAFAGCRAFLPIRPDDGLYGSKTLGLVGHPEAGEPLLHALSRFLYSYEPSDGDRRTRLHRRCLRLGLRSGDTLAEA